MFEAFADPSLTTGAYAALFVALFVALAFEFVNGFHDTANACATVIYTNSLKPSRAVLLSGLFNFIGVFAFGIAVAMKVLDLLPPELLVAKGSGAGLAMVLSLLLSAILWNLGTWYLGLPASSSHTLIGAILGVGIANSLLPGHTFGSGVNWGKAKEVGLALLISPLFGFTVAGGMLMIMRKLIKNPELYSEPKPGQPPPWGIRALLIATCSGVSFAHGSNDGQKGVGLIMLILIGIVPAGFALNLDASADDVQSAYRAAVQVEALVSTPRTVAAGISPAAFMIADMQPVTAAAPGSASATGLSEEPTKSVQAAGLARKISTSLGGRSSIRDLPREVRWEVRSSYLTLKKTLDELKKSGERKFTDEEQAALKKDMTAIGKLTGYAPTWVLVAVALALGVGTTVGWKRIVVTVGEKIGKNHLTYAQGASAELVATSTIGVAALWGLPVSTTHVLSSGVAGTMVASGSDLQRCTVKNILLAWVLTLPVTILLSGALYLALHAALC